MPGDVADFEVLVRVLSCTDLSSATFGQGAYASPTDPTGRGVGWRWLTRVGQGVFVIVSLLYVVLGQPNADEGWYLYASRLVVHGQIPFRDFAFTQAPLLPYVYGVTQAAFGPGMYVGRVTSLFLSLLSLLIATRAARRLAGEQGAALAVWLLASYTFGIYFVVIVKTYALVSLFFIITLAVLATDLPEGRKWQTAVAAGLVATLVRLSALPFLTLLVVASLLSARRRRDSKAALGSLALCGLGLAAFSALVLAAPHAAWWGLVGHHMGQWGQTPWPERLSVIVLTRIPDLVRHHLRYVPLVLGMTGLVVFSHRRRGALAALFPEQLVLVFGVFLFAAAHLVTGGWHVEYFVPTVAPLLVILGIVGGLVVRQGCRWERAIVVVFFMVTVSASLIRHAGDYVDVSAATSPLEVIHGVARVVADHTEPSDRLFVLEALWTAVDSDRRVLPGMTLAQFSYQEVPTSAAKQLRVVNGDLATEYLRRGLARVVVLTDLDWKLFERSGHAVAIAKALATRYDLVLTEDHFGQRGGHVFVFARKPQWRS